MIVVGTALALIGATTSVVYFIQPWRSCPDDDSPAGCPMLPVDATILTAAAVVALFGTAIAIIGAASRRRVYY